MVNPDSFSEEIDFEQCLEEYRCDSTLLRIFVVLGSVLFDSIFVGAGIIALLLPAHPNPDLMMTVMGIIFLLVGLLMLALSIRMGSLYLAEGNWRALVFDDKLILKRHSLHIEIYWDEISAVNQRTLMTFSFGEGDGIPIGAFTIYTIQTRKVDGFTISGVRVQELGSLIQRSASKVH